MESIKLRLFKSVKLAIGVLTLAFVVLLTSCGDDDSVAPVVITDDIVDLASASNDLSSLVDALGRFPDLVTTLSDDDGSFTVFAPTNGAFAALLSATGQSSLDDIPDNVLRRVLEFHVVSGAELLSSGLSNGAMATTVLGESVTVGISGSSVTISGANVSTADIEAVNGVIHIIDGILVPALETSILNTVVEPAYFNKNFSILTEAVVTAGLLNTLIDQSADLTVFAPDNDAFEAANITSLDGLTAADLEPILLYHVLGSEVMADDLPATGSAVTTLGGDFYLSINTGGVFINGSTQVVATDLDYDNGVVHVINKTLTPPSSNIVDIAVAASTATEAEYSQLVAALTAVENDASAANLVTVLSSAASEDGAPFTVFAPTDAAFTQLYADAQVADLDALIDAVGISTLEAVLTYHVIGGARIFSQDLPNLTSSEVSTLGGTFTLDVATSTITYTDAALGLTADDTSLITGTDILGTNGVIHTINKVILP